jgi:hypothetical protein
MKKEVLAMGIILAVSLSVSGCATIINGTTQKVPINSNPQGATAKAQDGANCTTPCSLELKRGQDHIIQIKKEGYEELSVGCQHVMSGVIAGNILLGGLIGAGIDAASGSMYRLTPESISVDLKPLIASLEKPGLAFEKMKELEELKNSGAISEEEYGRLKSKLLAEVETK